MFWVLFQQWIYFNTVFCVSKRESGQERKRERARERERERARESEREHT